MPGSFISVALPDLGGLYSATPEQDPYCVIRGAGLVVKVDSLTVPAVWTLYGTVDGAGWWQATGQHVPPSGD